MSEFKKKERLTVMFSIRCTPSLMAKINEIAEREGVNRVDVVKEALEHRYAELKGLD